MNNRLGAALAAVPLIAVVRHSDPEAAREIALAAHEGGLRAIEITATVPDADALLAQLREDMAGVHAAVLGAGTVLDPDTADRLMDAGAEFLVSPGLVSDVLNRGQFRDVPVVPGVMTPTEACIAVRRGCTVLKLFPADTVGLSHLGALLAVLPATGFVPTGGVGLAEVGAWLRAGALAVGVGSCLSNALERDGPEAVADLAAQLVATAATARTPDPSTTHPEERPR